MPRHGAGELAHHRAQRLVPGGEVGGGVQLVQRVGHAADLQLQLVDAVGALQAGFTAHGGGKLRPRGELCPVGGGDVDVFLRAGQHILLPDDDAAGGPAQGDVRRHRLGGDGGVPQGADGISPRVDREGEEEQDRYEVG